VQAVTLMNRFRLRLALVAEQDRARLEAVGAELASLLRQESYASLERARILVRAADENIFDETLLTALAAGPPMVDVRATPRSPTTFETVRLEIWFADPSLNTAAARELITCEWQFSEDRQAARWLPGWLGRRRSTASVQTGAPAKELGWAVSHYYPKPCKATVTARFRDTSQRPVAQANSTVEQALPITLPVVLRPTSGHWGLEILRSFLALFVALVVLISGAQDKIANLPLIQAFLAVLVVGLTADTIKNLLVKSTSS